jgi:hypothetical protein
LETSGGIFGCHTQAGILVDKNQEATKCPARCRTAPTTPPIKELSGHRFKCAKVKKPWLRVKSEVALEKFSLNKPTIFSLKCHSILLLPAKEAVTLSPAQRKILEIHVSLESCCVTSINALDLSGLPIQALWRLLAKARRLEHSSEALKAQRLPQMARLKFLSVLPRDLLEGGQEGHEKSLPASCGEERPRACTKQCPKKRDRCRLTDAGWPG